MKNQKAIYMKPESSIHYVFAECEGLPQVSKTESNGESVPPTLGGDGTGNDMNDAKNRTGWFFWDDEDDAAK